jgi:hypothetical protein
MAEKEVLALIRGNEKYIFLYSQNEESLVSLWATLREFVNDQSLSFTEKDATLIMLRALQRLYTEQKTQPTHNQLSALYLELENWYAKNPYKGPFESFNWPT